MNILVIAGYCLKVNSSANLCHAKYIDGLIQAGHTVDLLTVSEKKQKIDSSITMPRVRGVYEYDCSIYEQLSPKKAAVQVPGQSAPKQSRKGNGRSLKRRLMTKAKDLFRASYGVYGTDHGWARHAVKFRSEEHYDMVISLAYPPVSHWVAERLLKKKHIRADKWIQIWEDPWFADLAGMVPTERILREERRLLGAADVVYYVSPLTLMYQKGFFPESAPKMKWQPLPSYYGVEDSSRWDDELHFGYFGDYSSTVRNLRPFYDAAVLEGLNVEICGRSDLSLDSTPAMHIHPRLPLAELRPYEEQANVLVFLCNLKGGQIPGKIYQYSATDKRILFILDGTPEEQRVLKEYFQPFDRFVFCENSVASIREAVNRIRSGDMPRNANVPLKDFAPTTIIDKILRGE